YYYLGGFDPELARRSVGTLLTARAIETAVADGCREFDFLRGREPYKYRWGCIDRPHFRRVAAGRGALAACAVRALRWEQAIGDRLKRVAGRSNLPWHFKVLNNSDINAVSLPGGSVYVFQGLMNAVHGDRQMLAGVMAHECGHVAARHAVKQMEQQQEAGLLV